MSYLIQICHPNEMLSGKWQTIDEVSSAESAHECLQSPSFETEQAQLIRILDTSKDRRIYTGCYDEEFSDWLDLGPYSNAIQRASWPMGTKQLDLSFDERWRLPVNAISMLNAVAVFIHKNTITKTLIECSDGIVNRRFVENTIYAISLNKSQIEIDKTTQPMRRSMAYDNMGSKEFENISFAIAMSEIHRGTKTLVSSAVSALVKLSNEETMIDRIHQHLTFREIILGVMV